MRILSFLIHFIFLYGFLFFIHSSAYSQAPTDTQLSPTASISPTGASNDTEQINRLQDKIRELEGKVNELKKQGDSLSSQIAVMDNQIQLTKYRINSVQQQINETTLDIDSAGKRIKKLESSLNDVSKILLTRIKATYQAGETDPLRILLASSNLREFLAKENYLKIVQEHDKKLLYNTQQAKMDYASQKEILESKKKKIVALQDQLEQYNSELDRESEAKQELLAVTKNDEKNYQKMLSDAKARVASFQKYAVSIGGSSLVPPQTSPDGWFYHQRDSRWGNDFIGISNMPLRLVGCLITSTAMVRKFNGENITPADVARENGFFSFNTADMRIPWNGGRFTSIWKRDLTAIDNILASGELVIAGLDVGGEYGTHFIVLKSGSNGNYIMYDPLRGYNLNFTDYFSTNQIFQYGWLNG